MTAMTVTSYCDSTLHAQVRSALADNPYLTRHGLLCEMHDGRVVLRGEVGSYFQKQMAQESLRRLDGVLEIENLLEVNWHLAG